jgi:hypothetical protein
MSKLIVEMEMPIGCTWTDENENGHHCPLLDIDCDCVLQEKGRKIGWDEQYANCPIVGELPDEHGDLIDRDALLETCIYYNIDPNHAAVDADNIQDMPVIIAAERKDNENH